MSEQLSRCRAAVFCVVLENTPVAHGFQWYPFYYPEKLRKPEGVQRNRTKRAKYLEEGKIMKVQKQQVYVIHGDRILRIS